MAEVLRVIQESLSQTIISQAADLGQRNSELLRVNQRDQARDVDKQKNGLLNGLSELERHFNGIDDILKRLGIEPPTIELVAQALGFLPQTPADEPVGRERVVAVSNIRLITLPVREKAAIEALLKPNNQLPDEFIRVTDAARIAYQDQLEPLNLDARRKKERSAVAATANCRGYFLERLTKIEGDFNLASLELRAFIRQATGGTEDLNLLRQALRRQISFTEYQRRLASPANSDLAPTVTPTPRVGVETVPTRVERGEKPVFFKRDKVALAEQLLNQAAERGLSSSDIEWLEKLAQKLEGPVRKDLRHSEKMEQSRAEVGAKIDWVVSNRKLTDYSEDSELQALFLFFAPTVDR